MSNFLGTLTITATKANFDAPSDGVKAILIGNESGYTVTITMESGGVQKTLYPSTIDWFSVRKGFSGKILINPTVILNNVSSWPASSLIFDAIGLNDSEDGSQYPVVLPRNTNVGNTVAVTSGASTSIVNDNNTLNTQLIESTPSGGGGSTVQLTNAGVLVLGNPTHTGSLSTDNNLVTTNGLGQLTAKGLVAGLSNLVSHNNLTVDGSSSLDGGQITSDGTGNLTVQKLILALKGSITRIAITGSVSLSTAGASIAHGLGAIPDFVIAVNDAGGSSGAIANAVNFGTMTTTNVTVYSASGTPSVRLISIKL